MTAGAAPEAAPSLAGLERDHPEWRGWLAVLGAALESARDPRWNELEILRRTGSESRGTADVPEATGSEGQPWLAGAILRVDGRRLERWVVRLVEAAASADVGSAKVLKRSVHWPVPDGIAFVEASLEPDLERIDALAARAQVPSGLLRALAAPAVMPLLQACSRRAGPADPAWGQGRCPVCGSWPVLAEARGLEGSRQLRCGRCGCDWRYEWLRCPFCANRDHTSLGELVPEASGGARKVETCSSCRGYVKTVTTLTPRSAAEVCLEDLDTVAYDVAAVEAGWSRPDAPASTLGVRLELRRRGLFRGAP